MACVAAAAVVVFAAVVRVVGLFAHNPRYFEILETFLPLVKRPATDPRSTIGADLFLNKLVASVMLSPGFWKGFSSLTEY